MQAQASMCICIGRLAGAFAARIHKKGVDEEQILKHCPLCIIVND